VNPIGLNQFVNIECCTEAQRRDLTSPNQLVTSVGDAAHSANLLPSAKKRLPVPPIHVFVISPREFHREMRTLILIIDGVQVNQIKEGRYPRTEEIDREIQAGPEACLDEVSVSGGDVRT
jgi:hypothetical protein